MKRLIALLLAALLLLAAIPALAADYPIEEKFYRQMQESAYRGTITFSVHGSVTDAVDRGTWNAIRTVLPRMTVEMDHSLNRGEGQATLSLLMDGQAVGKTTLLYHDTLMGISSDLLAGSDTYYTAARDWDITQLVQTVIQYDSAWPPLWRVLLAILNAPKEWQDRAQPYLAPYETKLGIWMNGYAATSSGSLDGVPYTELACSIPGQAVKTEIKQLLVDFYGNAELLALLREAVTAQEAAAYLQPAMMNSFFSMLDALELRGNVEIVRRYDAQGKTLLDQISLPFAESQSLSALTVSRTAVEAGDRWAFTGRTRNGMDFDVSCIASEEMIFTGEVTLMMPEGEDTSFVVSDTALPRRVIAFDYNFSWDPGEEKYTLATDRFERTLQGTLLIRPAEGQSIPTQSLALEITFSSGSSQRSATQLNGTLTWHDLDSDASITATLSSRTAAPFAISTLDNVVGMRVDLLSGDTLSAVIQSWRDNLSTNLSNLISQLSASVFSFSTPSR